MHQRSNCSGDSTPAQVSKICTTSAPALSWPTRYSIEPRTKRSINRAKALRIAIGKQPRRRLVRRCLARHHVGRDRPGRAAKSDQRGLAIERRFDAAHRLVDRRQHLAVDGFVQARRAPRHPPAARAWVLRRPEIRPCGRAPAASIRISENKIAASKPNRRTGCSVTSAASSGLKQRSRNPPAFSRTARYSGRYRPAWRIIQTGGTCFVLPCSARAAAALSPRSTAFTTSSLKTLNRTLCSVC